MEFNLVLKPSLIFFNLEKCVITKIKKIKTWKNKIQILIKKTLQINFTLSKFVKRKIPQHWIRPFPILLFLILVKPIIFLIIPIGYHWNIDKNGDNQFFGRTSWKFSYFNNY
jgi:hypothetical protein